MRKIFQIILNKATVAFILLTVTFTVSAQNGKDLQFISSFDIKGHFLITDALGNFYVINENVLTRYDGDGRLLSTHSNLADGNFTSVDVSDPLKILIFSKEFGHIRYLDNTLSTKGDVLSLADLGFVNASLVCSSYESGLWIYDPVSIQLVRFNNNLQAFQFSGNIAQLSGFEVTPNFLFEYNNLVYLGDSANGILVFDRYGAYMKTLPFKGVRSMQLSGETYFLFIGSEILAYNTKTLQENKLQLPLENVISACLVQGRLYLLTTEKLFIYKVE